jgi:hypothetical protein
MTKMDLEKFLEDIEEAGFMTKSLETRNFLYGILMFSNEEFTVDELMALLWENATPEEAEAGRKYTLGYFGGSGSTKLKFNKGKKKGIRKSELTRERKRDSSGRFIY